MAGQKLAKLKLRRARPQDAARLAELSGQLGYPAGAAQMKERLKSLRPAAQHAAIVAELTGKGVIGWIHVSVDPLLEVESRAEVNGLVVAEGNRSAGAGWALLEAAERWAKAHGCKQMSVRSNVVRERAHEFYERHGYEHYKTQKAFRKRLKELRPAQP
ncbi:MAG TPA: GNAT family N-acetyltransferase [Terriglobales bacterium]|nr:GNAT family N-acetyltransferase [Terriglobales bacterium]